MKVIFSLKYVHVSECYHGDITKHTPSDGQALSKSDHQTMGILDNMKHISNTIDDNELTENGKERLAGRDKVISF